MFSVGVDEVGYGCWAGPVVVCALKSYNPLPEKFQDSKSLSQKKRQILFQEIIQLYRKGFLDLCVSFGSVQNIIQEGILPVTLNCMKNAINYFGSHENPVFIDGRNKPPDLSKHVRTVIRGDETLPIIGAASIFAKEFRDAYMRCLSLQYPEYLWCKNMGYGTKDHRDAIAAKGVTSHHRVNYKPLQKYRLYENRIVESARRF